MKKFPPHIYILCFLLLLLVNACKTSHRKIGEEQSQILSDRTEFMEVVRKNTFRYQTLTARINAQISFAENSYNSRMDMKMIRDSAFQVSIQPLLGIEVFKMEISKDSIKIIDRLNKQYMAESFKSLEGQTPVEFNFHNLQALFTNQLFLPGTQELTPQLEKRFSFSADKGKVTLKIQDAMKLLYTFLLDAEGNLLSTRINDKSEKYFLNWHYEDFRILDKQLFPMQMSASLYGKGKEQGRLILNFSKIETNKQVSLSFSISSKYKRITFAQIKRIISPQKK